MNILAILQALYAALSPFANSPEGRTILHSIESLVLAVITKSTGVNIGGYHVSASLSGSPAPLTASSVVLALEHILAGKEGDVQSGSVVVSIAKAV